jgi:uncharacterized protein with ParB-like and HNH nuclease domain
MAKNKYMHESSLEELFEELNFFVPEIQREYVWGFNEREILDAFCEDLINGKDAQSKNEELDQKIAELTAKQEYSKIQELIASVKEAKPLNIGFLYSYEPNYRMEHFPDSDIYKDVYLIDGQQRLTTLFLLLFYLSIKEKRRGDFINIFRFDSNLETLAFDYRVRNLTHKFFIELIKNVDSLDKIQNIKEETWFLMEYADDPTVRAILSAFSIITKHFSNLGDHKFFDYLYTKIKFWHFKTEKTDQGEELYITMNSRGKQLEDNETLRAKLFEKISSNEEIHWSEKWEEWQNYFWQNRNRSKGPTNSDKGFNEFLRCIAGLEAYKQKSKDFLQQDDPIYASRLIKYLSLEKIENYFRSLKFVLINYKTFASNYEYSEWLPIVHKFINQILFERSTNWFIDYNDELRAGERRLMVFLWSVLEYVNRLENNNENLDNIYRFIRVYWLRYNNHDRSVTSLIDRVNNSLLNSVWYESITEEEEKRHSFLNKIDDYEYLRKLESAIWRLEDHPLNLSGYQVQNINISHLVDLNDNLSLDILKSIYDRFTQIFPVDKPVGSKTFSTLLLFYDFYAMKRRPNYYDNWDFSSWRRIVRDLDSDKNAFKTFLSEFNGQDLNEMLKEKQQIFLLDNKENIQNSIDLIECDNLLDCLKIYSIIINNFWSKGLYIAYSHYLPNKAYTTFEEKALFNTKGNFRGQYGHIEFCHLVENSQVKPIEHLKKLITNL